MTAPPRPELDRAISQATSAYSLESSDGSELGEVDGSEARSPPQAVRRNCFDRAALETERLALIEECADCLGIDGDDAAIFLSHHQWDVDSFTQSCFDDETFLDRLRHRLRISEGGSSPSSAPAPDALCEICFCEPPVAGVVPCGHGYCMDCWQRYVSLAVEEGKACLELRCPFPKCGERIRASQVLRLCASQVLADRFRSFLVDAFVQDHRLRKWCPGQNCGLACERSGPSSTIECSCGMVWCFDCSNDDHQPVPCKIVEDWNKTEVNEGNDVKWIMANTKSCPKCANPIEKNGGCMHMTCRKPGGCGYEFCWICMGPWEGHVVCNAAPEPESAVRARSDLQTYAFYWDRFQNHQNAQHASEGELKEKMTAIVACFLADSSFNVKDTDFLMEANEQITRCRRFLKWTYAFAYFLLGEKKKANKRKLFEFHQAQLEGTLERLSDIVENTDWLQFLDVTFSENKELFQKRTATISLTKVVRDFFASLASWIQETFPSGT